MLSIILRNSVLGIHGFPSANRTTNDPSSGLKAASICYGEYFNLSSMSIKGVQGAQTLAASEQEH